MNLSVGEEPTARTTGGAREWIVAGDPLPADDPLVTAVFGPGQTMAGGGRIPLMGGSDAVWVQSGRVTIAAPTRARWAVRVGLLLWIAGWVIWLLRRR